MFLHNIQAFSSNRHPLKLFVPPPVPPTPEIHPIPNIYQKLQNFYAFSH